MHLCKKETWELNVGIIKGRVKESWSLFTYVAAAKSRQSCPTLCSPIDGSPPGFPVPGILQARTLEWVAISSSNAWKRKGKVKSLSRVRLLATPWTASHQAPPPMGFPRQEYWSGVPSPSLVAFIRCLENYGSGHFPSSRGNQNVFLSCLLMTPARSFSLPSTPAGGRPCHLHANNTKLVCWTSLFGQWFSTRDTIHPQGAPGNVWGYSGWHHWGGGIVTDVEGWGRDAAEHPGRHRAAHTADTSCRNSHECRAWETPWKARWRQISLKWI